MGFITALKSIDFVVIHHMIGFCKNYENVVIMRPTTLQLSQQFISIFPSYRLHN